MASNKETDIEVQEDEILADHRTELSDVFSGRLQNPCYDELTEDQKSTLNQLHALEVDSQVIKGEYYKAWDLLKTKFISQCTEVYNKREGILGKEVFGAPLTGTPALPDFWLSTMREHPMLDDVIAEQDIPALRFLEDIEVLWDFEGVTSREVPFSKGFTLNFKFKTNPFFKNKVLTKQFVCRRVYIGACMWNDLGEDILTAAIGCEINWLPNQNLTHQTVTRRQKNRKTNETRVVNDVVSRASFFNFFQTHHVPDRQTVESLTRSEIEDIDVTLEAEYECGLVIRDKIVPNALGWFLGVERDSDFEDSSYSYNDEESDEYQDE